MAPSATPDSPPSTPNPDIEEENSLQPFFVLHKAIPQKSERKASGPGKTRRKIDLSPTSPKSAKKSKVEAIEEEDDDHHYEKLRIEAFDLIWSRIETTIKDVLREINVNVFDDIHHWVRQCFSTIRSSGTPGVSEITRSYPLFTDLTCRQIFTGLVFTKNVEFVDDLLTFQELGEHLKSCGCHVCNLSSLDFSIKNGLGGCLRSLLRQLVMVTPDAADIAILASWYSEEGNCSNPLVVIIDEMERCSGSVLAEFIMLLSEWVIKIPVIFIMGVTTTVDAPRNLLPSNALQKLCPCKFTLGSPAERMDAIVDAILLKSCFGFTVGYKVANFLRNYFLKQDGTVTSFVRALKIACAKHFLEEPLSFMASGLLEDDSQSFWKEKCVHLPERMLKCAFNLPSCEKNKLAEETGENLANGLSDLKNSVNNWTSVLLCLYEAGKFQNMQLLDIFCEALDPALYKLNALDNKVEIGSDSAKPSSADHCLLDGQSSGPRKGSFIFQAVRRVKDLPLVSLSQLFKTWRKYSEGITEFCEKVKELQSMLRHEDNGKSLKRDAGDTLKRPSRSALNTEDMKKVNHKVAILMQHMVRKYLKPIECVPFHEIICFKHIDILQSALIGDPRRKIQFNLLNSRNYLQCNCCNKSGSALVPSMHDTSIMYTLAQEHGDLINLHDWYQSFKTIVLQPSKKGKQKVKQSPSSKKGKFTNDSQDTSEASIQARFCRALTELQITGLFRMPSKRRRDFVQRVAFGL
ncbi:origin of replication complex subunit 3 [Macadamia integrifolia]|uniref:origin of replication complex subunit 3 n=1 Tax=Macadamia integrifolia TaxID=60698 RepID=UPI001C4EF822|nr:origin of replication complex subunit 3 [Macadamia integrifolia]